jgi:hypothetical protein
MPKKELAINLAEKEYKLSTITAVEYCDLSEQSIPIFEDYTHYLFLSSLLESEAPDFNHPRFYTALKGMFGESSEYYDDYKCSFGYQFLIVVVDGDKESKYMLNLCDLKGGFSFYFRKLLLTPEELEKYKNRDILYKPFDDFSKDEMAHFMSYFMFYLVGFMKSYEEYYDEEFIKSLDYNYMIYGYKNGKFFENTYDEDTFYEKVKKL